jgi:hypothetical protein
MGTQRENVMSNLQRKALCMSLLALSAIPALADGVSGGVAGKDKQFTPTHVAAFHNKSGTMVILSAEALDSAAIVKSSEPSFTAMNDRAVFGKENIILGVDSNNVVQMTATLDGIQNLDSSGVMFGTQGMLTANCTANTEERVACHVSRPENPNPTAKKWVLDVTFDSVVLQIASD